MKYTDYVDKELSAYKDSKNLYLFKKQILSEMAQRANEIISAGIDNEKVLNDLVISEYSDIGKRYTLFVKEKSDKKKNKINTKILIAGVLGAVLAVAVLYLCVSFLTNAWSKTWLIIVGSVVAGVIGVFFALGGKLEKKFGKFNLIQRLFSVIGVFLATTFLFLTLRVGFGVMNAWLIYIAAVALALIIDVVMAIKANEKTAFANLLIYIPVIATVIYVVTSILGVLSWHPGWLLVVISFMADIVLVMVRLLKTSKTVETETEDDEWSED